jgi:hypothetical protein
MQLSIEGLDEERQEKVSSTYSFHTDLFVVISCAIVYLFDVDICFIVCI